MLGVADQPCILVGVKVIIVRQRSFLDREFARGPPQLDKLGNHLVLMGTAKVKPAAVPYGTAGIIAIEVEASITLARPEGRLWVDRVEMATTASIEACKL